MRTCRQTLTISLWLLSLFFAVLPLRQASAETSASAQNFQPSIHASDYWTLSGSQGLKQWQFHVGLLTQYAHQVVLRRLATGTQKIVDDLFLSDFFGSIGLLDWLEFGLGIPVVFWDDSATLAGVRAGSVLRNSQASLGDLRIEPKFRIYRNEDRRFGLAAVPFFLLPTGNGDRFVGNNSFAGGARVVLDGEFFERLLVSLNVGFLIREKFVFPGTNTRRDEAFLAGLGLNIRLADWLDLIAEANGSFLAAAPFDRESEFPLELGGGFRFHLPWVKGMNLSLGGSAGMTKGYGNPDFRIFSGVSYTRPREEVFSIPSPPPLPLEPPPLVEQAPTREMIEVKRKIHFEYGKAEIRPISYTILDEVIKVLKENPDLHKVEIGGHTDSEGAESYNLQLSLERAEAVRRYLVEQGIEPERLTVKGYGESRPRDTNETDLGRARNRRIEFVILERGGEAP